MVEASIVVSLVVIFVSVLFYIGMIMYQHSAVSIMANQTASNIAQVYSNTIKDPFTGYIDSQSVYQDITYSTVRDDAQNELIKKKANYLAKYNMRRSRIVSADTSNVDVQIVNKPNELLKSQVVVTITDSYEVPLVSIFGVNNSLTFEATGRADCVDLLEYLNGVPAVGDPEYSNSYNITNSDVCLVTFYENDFGGGLVATVPVYRNMSISSSNKYTHSSMPENPTSSEFEFTSWITEDGEDFTSQTVVANDMIVYGIWQCTVTLDAQGGTVNPTSIKATVNRSANLPTPSRQCYIFKGWYDQKSGGEYYDSSSVIMGNITLYASWKENHDYKNYKVVNGTCVKRAIIYQRCSRCGKERTIEGAYGGHNYRAVSSQDPRGVPCNARVKTTYKCSYCGNSYTGDGQYGTRHTFYSDDPQASSRCDTPIKCNVFYCESTGGKDCGARTMYHVLCSRCGRINDGSYTTKYGKTIKIGYWCGLHGTKKTLPCPWK